MTTPPWFFAHALSVAYPDHAPARIWRRNAPNTVVKNASLSVARGQTVAIIGESGSGKSTLGRALVQLLRPTEGMVQLGDVVLTDLWHSRAQRQHRRRLQMVFQDSWASLDAHQSIGAAIAEPLIIHKLCHKQDIEAHVAALLSEVGLDKAFMHRWPHALSGGQRQRINIARALAAQPDILVADEPTSALDVSVKGHVLFMLQRLVKARQMGLVFISHDLPAVRFVAQRVIVMYAGRTIEAGPTEAVFKAPRHPYTQALLEAAPLSDPQLQRARLHRAPTQSVATEPANSGCPYRLLCPRRVERCDAVLPILIEDDNERSVACHRAHDGAGHSGLL